MSRFDTVEPSAPSSGDGNWEDLIQDHLTPQEPARRRPPSKRADLSLGRPNVARAIYVPYFRVKQKGRIYRPPLPLSRSTEMPLQVDGPSEKHPPDGNRPSSCKHQNPQLACPPVQSDVLPTRGMQKLGIDQIADFWESYNKKADFEDREFVKAVVASLEGLLIFAGLFSGVNTAFILESMKGLQPDQSERTNEFLSSISLALYNVSNSAEPHLAEPFAPSSRAVRSTAVFFISLCCSLTAAFGAVLAKQWLSNYEREGSLRPPADRARERQRKSDGRDKWRLEDVIEALPTILQLSLYLFLIALVDFLWPVNSTVAWATLSFALIPFLFHLLTTVIASLDSSSPFQTRLSLLLRNLHLTARLWRFLRGLGKLSPRRWRRQNEDSYDSLRNTLKRSSATRWPGIILRAFTHNVIKTYNRLRINLLDTIRRLPRVPSSFHITSRLSALFKSTSIETSEPDTYQKDACDVACVIFSIRRASTPEDIVTMHAAMNALPLDPQIDRSHPVVTSFAETITHFLLKPTFNSKNSRVEWGNPNIDFQPLLRVLYLLFVRWDYTRDHVLSGSGANWRRYDVDRYQYLFWFLHAELWDLFSRDPNNPESVKLIANIVSHGHAGYWFWEWSQKQVDILLQCLNVPEQDYSTRLPYLSLLCCITSNAQFPNFMTFAASSDVPKLLLSTMRLDDGKWDLDFHRGRLRFQWLPYIMPDAVIDRYTGTYLLEWFNFNIATNSIRTVPVLKCYLDTLCRLLDLPNLPINQLRSRGGDDHIASLVRILNGEIDIPPYGPQPLGRSPEEPHTPETGRCAALYCLLAIWHRHQEEEEESEGRLTFTEQRPESVQAVINCLASLPHVQTDHLVSYLVNRPRYGMFTWNKRVLAMMEYIVLFLEEASHLKLLVRGMEPGVGNYKRWGDQILGEDARQPLYVRLDVLVFTRVGTLLAEF